MDSGLLDDPDLYTASFYWQYWHDGYYGSPDGDHMDMVEGRFHDIALVSGSVVPLPAAVWLFGSALAGLGWIRRKQTV
jgi:hypothetical protein